MGFFDTLLTAIAPERAVKRVAAQTAIRAINSGYSNYGASLHKKSMRGWMWHGGSPKEDIEDNLRVLRERSRDAYMGVPLATGAIKTMRTNVVCGGLTPTPQIDNAFLGISDEEAQKINEQIAREFAGQSCRTKRRPVYRMTCVCGSSKPTAFVLLRLWTSFRRRTLTSIMLKRSCKVLKPMQTAWSLRTGFATGTRWRLPA